jgi:3-oxoacyl-[acyl-carrier protein] reductase
VLTYHQNAEGATAVMAEIVAMGRRAATLRLDLSDESSIHAVGRAAAETFGRVDVWINNAGADVLTGPSASLSTVNKLDLLIAVDLRGTMLASWVAADILGAQSNGGVIINISWDHVLTGMAGLNPQLFAAVKGGVLSFSKALARSLAPKVRVNVIAPGWVATAFSNQMASEFRDRIVESTPMKRWGTPDDVANAAVFLASPGAAFLTGQTILVGGGIVM